MSFSYSGGVVTQTGTDTDLSGMIGLTNVNDLDNGSTGQDKRTVIDLATNGVTLVVNGTLSYDPREWELWIPNVVDSISGTGTLTIGGSDTLNSVVSYRKEQAISVDALASGHAVNSAVINTGNNSDLDINCDGGVVYCRGAVTFQNGTINDLTLRTGTDVAGTGTPFEFAFDGMTVNSLTIDGRGIIIVQAAGNTFNELNFTHTDGLFASGSSGAENIDSRDPISGYSAEGQNADIRFWRGGKFRLRDSSVGSNAIAVGHGVPSNANSTGCWQIEQTLRIHTTDSSGDVSDVYWYVPDYDNGNRQNDGYTGGSATANASLNLTGDITYSGTTDVNGEDSEVIVTAYANRTTDDTTADDSQGTYDTGPNRYDRRTLNDVAAGVNLDQKEVFLYSYNHDLKTEIPSFIGLGGTDLDALLFVDDYITNSNRSAVDVYTTIDNPDEDYDSHKSWKVTAANTPYPTRETMYLNGAGLALSYGACNLVIDSTLGSSDTVSTSGNGTRSVKTSNYTAGTTFPSGITFTTGTCTVSSGDELSANIAGNLTAPAGATVSGVAVIGSTQTATIGSPSVITGTLSLSGQMDLADLTTAQMSGTLGAASQVTIDGASTSTELDLRNMTVESGYTIENDSGVAITVRLLPSQATPVEVETSGTITVNNSAPITHANLDDDTVWQLYDVDGAAEIATGTTSGGTGLSYDADASLVGNVIRLRNKKTSLTSNKRFQELTGTLTDTGLIFTLAPADFNVYETNNVDGSTVAGVSWDGANIQIDISDANNSITWQEINAWYEYFLASATGLAEGELLYANTTAEYVICCALQIQNTKTTDVLTINGGYAVDENGVPADVYFPATAGVSAGIAAIFAFGAPSGAQLASDVWNYTLPEA